MKIGQALAATWKKEEEYRIKNHPFQPRTPLMHYLKFNYHERYVKLCNRVNVEPVSLGKWLLRDIQTV